MPDEYDLNLEIARGEATVAYEHPCDSKNTSLRQCPKGYNDGDLYVFKRLDIPCPKVCRRSLWLVCYKDIYISEIPSN